MGRVSMVDGHIDNMTPQETIETIKIAIAEVEWNYPMGYAVAFENAISALEKQIPKKPIKKTEFSSYEYVSYRCPICNQHFLSKIEGEFLAGTKPKHCYKCGQKLLWESED